MSNVLIFSQQRHSLNRRICHSQSDKGQSIVTHIEKRQNLTAVFELHYVKMLFGPAGGLIVPGSWMFIVEQSD